MQKTIIIPPTRFGYVKILDKQFLKKSFAQ